jgi:23S rRNA (uracil1939-C5)-methyltransferase
VNLEASQDPVIRLAAKGDGLTASGAYVAGSAPGDALLPDGSVVRGPNYVTPVCRHFGVSPSAKRPQEATCGGCSLQQVGDGALADFVRDRVVHTAAGQGLVADVVAPTHLSPAGSRRRATLHGMRIGGAVALGFRQEGSHTIVDLKECPVLAPELAAIVGPLRKLLARRDGRLAVDIDLTLADQGVDVAIRGLTVEGLAQTEAILDFARDQGLARLSLDQGYGPESLWEPDGVTVTLSGVAVPLPPGAFLQATADGEAALVDAAAAWLKGASPVADLFSGLGTFAFALAKSGAKVLAGEADQAAHLACKSAAGRSGYVMQAQHRDLFRNPLLPEDLNRFAAVLLDPPRAGARDQIERIAQSTIKRVVYISCNPSSWARDGATLAAAGFKLRELRPVGQFRWTTHVELASYFTRD